MNDTAVHRLVPPPDGVQAAGMRSPHPPRPRLLEQIGRVGPRLVVLTGGPGYGKTTLLDHLAADWPGPVTWQAGMGIQRVRPGGGGSADPLVIVDLADHEADAGWVQEAASAALVDDAPGRVALASRTAPVVPHAARLRAEGRLVELGPADLAFRPDEVERLLPSIDSSERSEVVAAILERTGGWPALVALLAGRLGRGDRRRALERADEDLAAYLDEELLASDDPTLRSVLEAIALTGDVDGTTIAALLDLAPDDAARAIARSMALGLLLPQPDGPYRLPAALRDRLLATLSARIGADAHARLRRRAAAFLPRTRWTEALAHLEALGASDEIAAFLLDRLPEILDGADIERALGISRRFECVAALPADLGSILDDLLGSRLDHRAGHPEEAIVRAATALERALRTTGASPELVTAAAAYLAHLAAVEGDHVTAIAAGRAVPGLDGFPEPVPYRAPGPGSRDVPVSWRDATGLAVLAVERLVCGDHAAAATLAAGAADRLRRTGSPSETALALSTEALARLALGEVQRSELALAEVAALASAAPISPIAFRVAGAVRILVSGDGASLPGTPVDSKPAEGPLAGLPIASPVPGSVLAALDGRPEPDPRVPTGPGLTVLEEAPLWRALRGLLAILSSEPSPGSLPAAVEAAAVTDPFALTLVAPWLVARSEALAPAQLDLLEAEAGRRPERWRPLLRRALDGPSGGPSDRSRTTIAVRLLAGIGEQEDIPRLVAVLPPPPRTGRGSGEPDPFRGSASHATLVRGLARRFAPRLFVEDLGTVRLLIGEERHPVAPVRRKVLALVCYLLTRPDLTATQDELVDALWAGGDPAAARNSLNQTVYYLRRTIEDRYDARRSPHYVVYDRELVSLDGTLVDSRGRRCLTLLDRCERGGPEVHRDEDDLAEAYGDRFALDFLYEPWTEAHRESLHLRYLAVMERAVRQAGEADQRARGIRLARRVLQVDPTADPIELALLRLLRADGAPAAAAEQYAHYRTLLRDELGIEPPPFDSI